MAFVVPPAIASTSSPLLSLELCDARLQLDARYPWIVLVPRRHGVTEIEQLSPQDRSLLIEEAVLAGEAVRAMGQAIGRSVEKLNIASLGNVTASLHVHVLGRRADDFCWPSPVWGLGEPWPWEPGPLALAQAAALQALRSRPLPPAA